MTHRSMWTVLVTATLIAGCSGTTLTGAPSGSNGQTANPVVPNGGAGAFIVGRKWDYTLAVKSAAISTNGTMSIEISDIKDGKGTAKVTTTLPPAPAITASNTFDINDKQAFSKVSGGSNSPSLDVVSTGSESVTVAAGTFTCVKTVYKSSTKDAVTEMTQWVDEKVGLIKSVSSVKPTAAAPQLPAGVTLPGGVSLDMSSTTTIELTSFK